MAARRDALHEQWNEDLQADRTFDLVDSPDAVRYLAEGHPAGKIVVTV